MEVTKDKTPNATVRSKAQKLGDDASKPSQTTLKVTSNVHSLKEKKLYGLI